MSESDKLWRGIAEAVTKRLKSWGVRVNHWNELEPPTEEQETLVAVADYYERSEERSKLGDEVLAILDRRVNTLAPVRQLLQQGDQLALAGDESLALSRYEDAVEKVPWPGAQIEVGGLLLHRARSDREPPDQGKAALDLLTRLLLGLEPLPVLESNFDLEELRGGSILRSALGPELIPGPVFRVSRTELRRLAREAYGRSVAHFLRRGIDALCDLDRWRMYPALDGLRILALDDLQDPDNRNWLEFVCAIYGYWESEVGWRILDMEDENPFDYRFAGTHGYLLGFEAGSAIGEATEVLAESPASIRQVLAEHTQILKRIMEHPQRMSDVSKSEIEEKLQREFGDEWRRIDPLARQSIIEGDVRLARGHNAGEEDFAHVIIFYSRAVEGILRELSRGANPEGFWGSLVIRRAVPSGAFSGPVHQSTRSSV